MARAQSPFSIRMRWTRHSFLARRKSASRPGENILSATFGDTRRAGVAGKSTERLPPMPQTCIAFARLPKRHDGELLANLPLGPIGDTMFCGNKRSDR